MAIPTHHKAVVRLELATPAAEVWPVIDDFASWPAWNKAVRKMERADAGGKEIWVQTDGNGKMPTEIMERTPPGPSAPGKLVTRIVDEGMPFGGAWTWDIAPAGTGCVVTITEDGFIRSMMFRVMAHYVFGYTGTQEKYLASLAARFQQSAKPIIVASGK